MTLPTIGKCIRTKFQRLELVRTAGTPARVHFSLGKISRAGVPAVLGCVIFLWTLHTAHASVAVVDFTVPAAASNQWSWAERAASDLLQIDLERCGVDTLDRDFIRMVVAEQRLATSGHTAEGSLKLASLLHAQQLISGQLSPLDNGRFRVESTAFSVEAVETLVHASGEGAFPRDLPDVLRNVARTLAGKLNAPTALHLEPEPPAYVPKPEALVAFYRGLNACARGRPEAGLTWFIEAARLDAEFAAPLIWQVKAYELAGRDDLAAALRQDLAPTFRRWNIHPEQTPTATERKAKPVLALLRPVLESGASNLQATVSDALNDAALKSGQVRLTAFEGLGDAVAEQDLRLGAFFQARGASRYGRWLMADGLLVCRVGSQGTNIVVGLSVLDPSAAAVIVHTTEIGPAREIERLVTSAVQRTVTGWTGHRSQPMAVPSLSALAPSGQEEGLRSDYVSLVDLLARVRSEPERPELHQQLAGALGSVGHAGAAALEVNAWATRFALRAPDADVAFLPLQSMIHSGLPGLDTNLLLRMQAAIIADHPQSPATACLLYEMARHERGEKNWEACREHALRARQIAEQFRDQPQPMMAREKRWFVAATYYLEGISQLELGRTKQAGDVLLVAEAFYQRHDLQDYLLPHHPNPDSEFGIRSLTGGGDLMVRTEIRQALARLGLLAPPAPATNAPTAPTAVNVAASDWRARVERCVQQEQWQDALKYFRSAMAEGMKPGLFAGLATVLTELALQNDPAHARVENERLAREAGIPVAQWSTYYDWFRAGRKYQTSRAFDFEKAAAAYRAALDWLEHPERSGFYALSNAYGRTELRWPGGLDMLWGGNYEKRHLSCSFYLAQCLVETGARDEAARLLREIVRECGGAKRELFVEDSGGSIRGKIFPVGTDATELLRTLHLDADRIDAQGSGLPVNPYTIVPARGARAWSRPPPPTAPDATTLQALTNALATVDHKPGAVFPDPHLRDFVDRFGHAAVPALLWLLPKVGSDWNEADLLWLLDQTAQAADAPHIVAICPSNWRFMPLAYKLDPAGTAAVLTEEWYAQKERWDVNPQFAQAVLEAHIRPLYPLALAQISSLGHNFHVFFMYVDAAARHENSAEFDAAFRAAMSTNLAQQLRTQDTFDLNVLRIALRRGVPEAIDALLRFKGRAAAETLSELRPCLTLPSEDAAAMALLQKRDAGWGWDAVTHKFQPTR